jgi:hypothetical protein
MEGKLGFFLDTVQLNTLQVGAEVVGQCQPKSLEDYLRYSHIYSPMTHVKR